MITGARSAHQKIVAYVGHESWPAASHGPPNSVRLLMKNHRLLKKLRFKSWVFVVFQGRLGAGDYIGIWYNLGIIFEKLCLPPMICPWSACDRPYIYRGLPSKCAKNFVLVNFFRFCKNREKSQKTQTKSGLFRNFFLRKSVFFIK